LFIKFYLRQRMRDNIDLSVIIVTWNSEGEIIDCLNSIVENAGSLSYEIIIVDNNSTDNTREVIITFAEKKFQRLKLISNNENSGFTKGCNTGINESSGKNILLLNPDTKILDSAQEKLLLKLNSDDNTAAIAPQLLNEDSTIQMSCRTFPRYFDMFCELSLLSLFFPGSKTFARWKMNYFSHNDEAAVDQPMAAALMMKRKILDQVGNLDERYLMFFNDVDLCRKIQDKGYKIIFYPDAKMIHEKGASIYKDRARMIKLWNDDCLSYFKKHNYNLFLYNWLSINLKLSGYLRILFYKLKK